MSFFIIIVRDRKNIAFAMVNLKQLEIFKSDKQTLETNPF